MDPQTTFNIYIADVNLFGLSTATGYTGLGANKTVIETIDPNASDNLLSHEFGHIFHLRHSWEEDYCDDTWGIKLGQHPDAYHDINCNGQIDPGEKVLVCWSNSNAPYCEDPQDCDYLPCCEWTWQDNNVMTSTAWGNNFQYSAFTDCQITNAIIGLGNSNSLKILAVDPLCVPPSAVISNNPIDDRILFTSASRNYEQYKIDILSTSNMLIKSTDWRTGITTRYRLSDDPNLTPGSTYIARLTVNSSCGGDSEAEVQFVQPPSFSQPMPGPCEETDIADPLLNLTVAPNPIESGNLTVQFGLPYLSDFQIYRIPVSISGPVVLEYTSSQSSSGNQLIYLDSNNWPSGIYGLYVIASDLSDYELFVKN